MHRPRNWSFIVCACSTIVGVLLCGAAKASPYAGDADLPEIRAGAEKGNVHQEIALGAAYFSGHGVQQDLKAAAYWYEKAAGSGDPLAQNEIGYFYQVGVGVPADPARAAHWFQLAAAGGFLDAKVNLGVAYMWGAGVPRNPRLAEQLIREAANKGSANGAAYLGDMYYFGVGIHQDQAAAEPWYEKGAKLHNTLAAFRMGTILSRPYDHPRDIQRAATLLRESASAGFVPAMHGLALILVNHPELKTYPNEALTLLEKAAAAGTWRASVVLGILARDGKLVPKDDKSAYFHLQVAALQGDDTTQKLIAKDMTTIAARLSPDDREKIEEDARAWTKKHNLSLEVIYKNGDHLSQFPAFALGTAAPDVHAVMVIPCNPY